MTNCLRCGRDTAAVYGICGKCLGGYVGQMSGRQRGEKTRAPGVVAEHDDDEDDSDVPFSEQQYNG